MVLDDFTLSPTSSLGVSITVPDWLRPYLQEWYTDTNDSETLEEFTLRIMGTAALNYRKNKLLKEGSTDYMGAVNGDYNTEVAKL